MSAARRSPLVRWAVPVGVAAVALGGGAAAGLLPASATEPLPPRTAAQLLVDLQGAPVVGLSGTVVQRADLGLPQLPLPGGQGSSDLTSLVSGNHTLRVWYGGPDRVRVALHGTLGESDVIRNGADLWTWSSRQNAATHRRLTAGERARAGALPGPSDLPLTPQQAADRALAAVDPSTAVTTAGTATVAGRSAYELVLTPRDAGSLVGQIRIAVDSAEHVPLRLEVFARKANRAAVQIGFTQVSFGAQPDSQFRFLPPPGVSVTESSGDAGRESAAEPGSAPSSGNRAGPFGRPTVIGAGWTSVVAARLPAGGLGALTGGGATGNGTAPTGDGPQRGGMSLDRVLQALPRVSGAWGSGRLLGSQLFTVLLTDDGRVYAGAVSADRLYRAAAQPLPAATR